MSKHFSAKCSKDQHTFLPVLRECKDLCCSRNQPSCPPSQGIQSLYVNEMMCHWQALRRSGLQEKLWCLCCRLVFILHPVFCYK